jgi:hypothetical protein
MTLRPSTSSVTLDGLFGFFQLGWLDLSFDV